MTGAADRRRWAALAATGVLAVARRLATRLVCGHRAGHPLGLLLLALSLAPPIPRSIQDMRVDRGFLLCPVGPHR